MTKAERQKECETRVVEYQASGQSTKAWCAAYDVKPHRLWCWSNVHALKRNDLWVFGLYLSSNNRYVPSISLWQQ